MNGFFVLSHIGVVGETGAAVFADIRFFAGVNVHVVFELVRAVEPFGAERTRVRPVIRE